MSNFIIRAVTEHGQTEFNCNGDNTELYLHRPQYKEVDHLFHRFDENDRRLGGFVWRQILGEEEFNQIVTHMQESGDFLITYRPEPTDADFDQYLHDNSGDIDTWQG